MAELGWFEREAIILLLWLLIPVVVVLLVSLILSVLL